MLDGYARYDKLVERAVKLGMTSVGITEHGNIHGWLEFYKTCKAAGVNPILGMEAYQARKTRADRDEEERSGKAADEFSQRGPHHLTMLTRNYAGYQNAMRLSSRAYLEGYYGKPRLDFELLQDHADGLILLSGCMSGKIQQAFARGESKDAYAIAGQFQEIVGKENFYVEVMLHGLPQESAALPKLVKLAEDIGAKIIPTGDCHYVERSDAHMHDLMLCVGTGSSVTDHERFKFYNDEFYLKSYDEMLTIFPKEWLQNTLDLAERCELHLDFDSLHFPEFPLPPGREKDEYLEELVWTGIKRRYGDSYSNAVHERTLHELGVVRRMGFQGYFLVVSDLVRWAKENGIRVGWGRGSAAGCILSYALGITNLDPIRFGLAFERFLVEGRKSMPDIDLDFDDRYRDRVIDYARSLYGDDRVAQIVTFGTIKARSAIRDAARALGHEYSEGDKLAKLVPPPVLGISKTLEECMNTGDFREAYNSSDTSREIIDAAINLEGVVRQTGIHAAGVVIAPGTITDYIPVFQKGEDKPIVTQWGMDWTEAVGLLKIDFLGLRNLGIIDDALKKIKQRTGEDIDLDFIDLNDAATYQMLCSGDTVGVFQLESSGIREMTLEMKPSSIEDIMALISLYRPGPMGSGMDKHYIARKNGREQVAYDHPVLEQILGNSYGIMLYQEDVTSVSVVMAGFDVGEADDLRKAIGKKQMDKIGTFRKKFVEGAVKTTGIDPKVADKIYSDIEFFGGYGFNRSHAASYAMPAYVTAYLKVHYPIEYYAALLTSARTNKDRTSLYLNDARKRGMRVLPPSICNSTGDFNVLDDQTILFGLQSISGIGAAIVPVIEETCLDMSYTSVYDFMRNCDPSLLDKGTIEHLLRSGAFDELVSDQPDRIISREEKMDILDLEKAELSLYVTDHPLLGVWHLVEESISHSIAELEGLEVNANVKVGGIVTKLQPVLTKQGKNMLRFTIEDLTGDLNVICFPRDFARIKTKFDEGDIILVEGKVQKEGDEGLILKLFMNDCSVPSLPSISEGTPIYAVFDGELDYNVVTKIAQMIEDIPGDSPVYIEFSEGRHRMRARFKKPTGPSIEPLIHNLMTLKNMEIQ